MDIQILKTEEGKELVVMSRREYDAPVANHSLKFSGNLAKLPLHSVVF